MRKHIPNSLSILRIFLSLGLLLIMNTPWAFACLVLVTGATDVVDGYVARKFHWETETGAKLDSLGDIVFYGVIMLVILLRYDWVLKDNLLLLAVNIILKIATAVISRLKYGEIAFIHTLANKVVGGLVFLSFLIIPFGVNEWVIKGLFLIAIFAAAEELGIILLSKKADLNQKSIFGGRK